MCVAVAYATACCSCYQASPISNNSKYNLLQLQLWGSESKFNKIQLKWRSVVLSLPLSLSTPLSLSLCSLFLHRWVSWGMQPADLSTRLVNLNENTATCARPFPPLLLWLPLSPSFPLFPLLYSLFSPSLLPFRFLLLCQLAELQPFWFNKMQLELSPGPTQLNSLPQVALIAGLLSGYVPHCCASNITFNTYAYA